MTKPRRCPHGVRDRDDCQTCRRGQFLTDWGTLLDELTAAYSTESRVPPAAIPGWKPADGRPVPKTVKHHTRDAGLLEQLENAAGRRPTRGSHDTPVPTMGLVDAGNVRGPRYGADITSHSKPGSRPPASLHALETLADVTAAAVDLRRRADHAAHRPTLPRARGIRGELRHLTWLLGMRHAGGSLLLDDRWADRLYREVRSWTADIRVTLSYLAPIVALRVRCPDCGGEMRVREDASSDVWCIGVLEGPALEGEPWPVRCGARWPRLTWVQLLDQTTNTREDTA